MYQMFEVSAQCVHPLCGASNHRRVRKASFGRADELRAFLEGEFLEPYFPKCPECHRAIARSRFVVWQVVYENGNEESRSRVNQQSTARGPRLNAKNDGCGGEP